MLVQTWWGTKVVYHRETSQVSDYVKFLLRVSLFDKGCVNLPESANLRHGAQALLFRLIISTDEAPVREPRYQ